MSDSETFLYRGVGVKLYKRDGKRLVPKVTTAFEYAFKYGDPENKYGSGAPYGITEKSAVIRHQLNQAGFPTSGISTTPHLYRAEFYATHGGKYKVGYVFKINRSLLKANEVTEYIVSEFVHSPSIPEDNEVILVHKDFGALPDAIIVEVMKIENTNTPVQER